MRIAAVMGNDGQKIVPLTDGPTIRIFDTEKNENNEFENPAIHATQGRRIATVKALLMKQVDAVLAPPSTFCEHSYKVAQSQGLRFFNIATDMTWEQVLADGTIYSEAATEIPQANIASHHHHHHT